MRCEEQTKQAVFYPTVIKKSLELYYDSGTSRDRILFDFKAFARDVACGTECKYGLNAYLENSRSENIEIKDLLKILVNFLWCL